ncbi:MAG: hypothetical protein ACLQEQ_01085 [Nitrososphaerales archaeon]
MKKSTKRKWVAVVAVAIALFVLFVPVVHEALPQHSNCVYCPAELGIDYSSIGYVLFGIRVYHTVWGAFVLSL